MSNSSGLLHAATLDAETLSVRTAFVEIPRFLETSLPERVKSIKAGTYLSHIGE